MNGDPRTGVEAAARPRTPWDRAGLCLAVALAVIYPWPANAGARSRPEPDADVRPASFSERTRTVRPKYPHRSVRREEHGTGGRSYWLFEPAGPTPEKAPVLVFNHGWLAVNPGAYGAWIEHLVRSGNVVIFPRYQRDPLTRPNKFLPNAVASASDALDLLETAPGRVRPDRDRFALIGHSAGGNLAAQMAAVASRSGLPRPRALITLMPGEVLSSKEPDLADVPSDTLLVIAVAENDRVVGDARAREIFHQTTSIPASRKRYVFYRSDLHGFPALIADHFVATGFLDRFDTGEGVFLNVQKQRAEINAFDRESLWPLADMTLRSAFSGGGLDGLSARGAGFKKLGSWSDGRPVAPPVVANHLTDMPRVFAANGFRMIKRVVDPRAAARAVEAAVVTER